MYSVLKGRKIVISIIVTILLIDFITIAITSLLYAVDGRMDYSSFKLLQGTFRFIIQCMFLFFLYKGHRWAKWVITILLLLGGIGSLFSLLSHFNVIMISMGVVYICIGIILIVCRRSVNDFLSYQRGDFHISDEN